MTIVWTEKQGKHQENEIMKAVASQNIMNDIMNYNNDPLYTIIASVQRLQLDDQPRYQRAIHAKDILIKRKTHGKCFYMCFTEWNDGALTEREL